LTTGTPAAAVTIAAMVEMFTVPAWSPRTDMSTARSVSRTRLSCVSIALAMPAISADVRPGAQRDQRSGDLHAVAVPT